MTELEYNLLAKIKSASPTQPIQKTELLNSGLASLIDIHSALSNLEQKQLISTIIGSDKITITLAGRNAYEKAKQERHQNAENKRQQRLENKISIASALVQIIIFIIGIVLEHSIGIVSWFLSLFST